MSNMKDESCFWETIIDFTIIKKGGIPLEDLLDILGCFEVKEQAS